jgi:predicted component of type VI protein secretion system
MSHADETVTIAGHVNATIPSVDLFFRDQPAEAEGPAEAWHLARAVVNYGCAVFHKANNIRPEHRIRDALQRSCDGY